MQVFELSARSLKYVVLYIHTKRSKNTDSFVNFKGL